MNCGGNGEGNTTPNPGNINACLGVPPFTVPNADVGARNIDLNTGEIFLFDPFLSAIRLINYFLPSDMALAFPLVPVSQANQVNGNLISLPDGGTIAKPLAHCVLDRKDQGGHQIQLNDLRCYGPGDGQPQGFSNAPFNEFQFVSGPFIDDATQTIQAWNDPTGTIQTVLKYMLPVVIQYARPTDGSNGNKNFLNAFQKSWVNMVTAGYTEINGNSGKLGSLTNYNGC